MVQLWFRDIGNFTCIMYSFETRTNLADTLWSLSSFQKTRQSTQFYRS
jgi:hypothetical protein